MFLELHICGPMRCLYIRTIGSGSHMTHISIH